MAPYGSDASPRKSVLAGAARVMSLSPVEVARKHGGFVRQTGRQIAYAKASCGAAGPRGAVDLGRTVRGVRARPIRCGLSCGRFRARRVLGERAHPQSRKGK